MGTWSADPFGNDTAADWAWELTEVDDWELVQEALAEVLDSDEYLDAEIAVIAVAAAEAVAHGLGRPTQVDAYTEDVAAFAARAGTPPAELVVQALEVLEAVDGPDSELAELWEDDPDAWQAAKARLAAALRG